jgi:four helix bundle protein
MTTHNTSRDRSPIRRYTELIVWQKAMSLVAEVYRYSRSLPSDERFGLTQQLRRAAVSIPSNIAEGHGRMTNGDYVRFLSIARGSLLETETLLQLCVNLGFMKPPANAEAMSLADEISRMLAVMIRKLGSRKSPKR